MKKLIFLFAVCFGVFVCQDVSAQSFEYNSGNAEKVNTAAPSTTTIIESEFRQVSDVSPSAAFQNQGVKVNTASPANATNPIDNSDYRSVSDVAPAFEFQNGNSKVNTASDNAINNPVLNSERLSIVAPANSNLAAPKSVSGEVTTATTEFEAERQALINQTLQSTGYSSLLELKQNNLVVYNELNDLINLLRNQ